MSQNSGIELWAGLTGIADDKSLRYYLRGQRLELRNEDDRKQTFARLLYNASAPPGDADLVSGAVIVDDEDSKVQILSIDHEMVFQQQQDEILVTPTCGYTDIHVGG